MIVCWKESFSNSLLINFLTARIALPTLFLLPQRIDSHFLIPHTGDQHTPAVPQGILLL